MLRQWLCFLTSHQIRHCWDVTLQPTSIFWLAQRHKGWNRSISKTQITLYSRPQPKLRQVTVSEVATEHLLYMEYNIKYTCFTCPFPSSPPFSQDVCHLEVSGHWGGSDRRRQKSMFALWMCRCLRAAVSIKAPAYMRTAWISWSRYRQFHWPGCNADKTANHSPNLFLTGSLYCLIWS